MVAKELRDMWWKLLAAAFAVIPVLLMVLVYLPPYESAARVMERFSAKTAVQQVLNIYSGGGIALFVLAILLGATLVSAEVGQGTIFLLLSKPLSRRRILFTKYAMCAGALLTVAALGHALLFAVAIFVKGYPLGLFSVWGMLLSTVLLWLASLAILCLATVFSTLFGNPLASLAVTCAAIFSGFVLFILALGYVGERVSLQTWVTLSAIGSRIGSSVDFTSESLYAGESLAAANLLVWLLLAVLSFVAALWVFGRKSY